MIYFRLGVAVALYITGAAASDAHADDAQTVFNQRAIAIPAYAGEASMQNDLQQQITVTTRVHPETDPQGIPFGSFRLYPNVGAEEKYNDNIYATNSGAITDYITTVSPDLLLASDWNNSQLIIEANSHHGFYASHTTENFNDYSFTATARLDITRTQYLAMRGGYSYVHEERTSPNNDFGSTPTTYHLTTGQLEYYNRFNRLSVTMDTNVSQYRYDDTLSALGGFIPNADRNRVEYAGSARLGYELKPLVEFYVKGTDGGHHYDRKVSSDGFQRTSTFYSVVSGFIVDFGGITFGEIGIGYISRSYHDPHFRKVTGVTADASLTWNVTPIMTVKLAGHRTIEDTTTFASPAYIENLATLSVDHELLRNLLLNANALYGRNDYQLNARKDDIIGAGFGATYLFSRNLHLSVSYIHRSQTSSIPFFSFDQDVALIHLTVAI